MKKKAPSVSVKKKTTKEDIIKFKGYKFFKENEDGSFDIVRFTGKCKSDPNLKKDNFLLDMILENGNHAQFEYTYLKENYTPIQPEGIVSFNIVDMNTADDKLKDVIVIMYKAIDIAIGNTTPYAVCRQSVNDFFSDFVSKDVENNNLVGVSCSRENCPTNIDFNILLSCSGIIRSDIVNYYKDDNFETLMECIPVEKYDNALSDMFAEHAKAVNDPILVLSSRMHDGWCKSLKDLLEVNNAIADFNSMLGIIGVDFSLSDHLVKGSTGVDELDIQSMLFLSEVIKCNIKETRVTEYNYSVDMSKFNNTNYTLIRDKNNKVYIVVYLVDGEFLEEELQERINKLDVTDRLRLAYYNKYSKTQY